MPLKKEDLVECTIESLAFGGRGVAHVDGMAVFVADALPGDTVKVRIVRAKKRFAEGVAETVVTPSSFRVAPKCAHFGQCGGCALQNLDYSRQLEEKANQVQNALSRIGQADIAMDAPAPSPSLWTYRNKMEFAFEQQDGSLHLGLRSRLPAGEKGLPPVLDIEECHLCAERDIEIVRMVREFCRESGIQAYDPKTQNGFWRHLVIRHTALGEMLVHVITSSDSRKYSSVEALGAALVERFSELTSFVHSSRSKRSTQAVGEYVEFRLGTKAIEEKVGHTRYHVSPNMFFQTNSAGAEVLFNTIREYGEFDGSESLLDLYCGAGAIGLYMADSVERVVGFEISEESIAKAFSSAKLNEFENCDFAVGSLDDGLGNLKKFPKFDMVVVDPPRSGMHENMAKALLILAPPKIVAVSCDPATLARDVKRLSDKYDIVRARAVDMFPHTHHIETVALLVRK
ncbi:23S rRNA (uracil(1939)-C(5))-methyltransferase RlmD [Pseudodesulfovibrio sp. JC047]|uniref:23S rRNA (uracil(1939)-C(5))-methyltransferase RlmD n=1 Tax=Pseudodesulfovibrio sp. JC047 TaxID=2683199 RepID=UPI0013D85A77|nr:23S rRNA (uracil(1939)-C(5))-methyltransferase RlmD [Pseudodesulfovibrio sp. JC047]NDV18903.1 23S rRNA (uracil(1939)-C(5))-methyltransferase RlmD [Pseudodesulfovibrio sp. JC047]